MMQLVQYKTESCAVGKLSNSIGVSVSVSGMWMKELYEVAHCSRSASRFRHSSATNLLAWPTSIPVASCEDILSRSSQIPGTAAIISNSASFGVFGVFSQGMVFHSGSLSGVAFFTRAAAMICLTVSAFRSCSLTLTKQGFTGFNLPSENS